MVNRKSVDYRSGPGLYPDRNFRMLPVSFLAAFIGVLAGFVAYGLYSLIALLSNLVFFSGSR
jgi:hypothetical protein